MKTPEYSKTYCLSRLVMQVILERHRMRDGISISVTPRVTVAFANRDVWLAVGIDWVFGALNIGWGKKSYLALQKENRKRIEDAASKRGLTFRQQQLWWRW